jgi:hypothetical protein
MIYNLRHENDDLEKDKANELSLKIEFQLKYSVADQKGKEA